MCPVRQITVETSYMTYLRETHDVLKLKTPRLSSRKKQKFSGGFRGVSVLESEVTESSEFDEEFEMMCQICILYPLHFVVFKQTTCHLTAEANVEQVFSRVGQLSEVNLDPNGLTDMVSIMVNKLTYSTNPVKDIMDKNYEKDSANKEDFFDSPDSPDHSDTDG